MIGLPLREMAATNTKARQGTESHSGDRSAPLNNVSATVQ